MLPLPVSHQEETQSSRLVLLTPPCLSLQLLYPLSNYAFKVLQLSVKYPKPDFFFVSQTIGVEQSPWEANSTPASQEILRRLRDPKVHYRFHNSPPRVPHIPSQINSVNATQLYCFRFILILSSHLRSSLKRSLSLTFSHQNPVCTCPLPHACHMPLLSPFFITILGEEYKSWSPVAQSDSDWLRAGRSGDRIPLGDEFFRTCTDRPWGPPSLLYSGYRVFPGGKTAGAWRWPPTPI